MRAFPPHTSVLVGATICETKIIFRLDLYLLVMTTPEIVTVNKPTLSRDSLCKSSKLLDFFFCGTLKIITGKKKQQLVQHSMFAYAPTVSYDSHIYLTSAYNVILN